MIAWGKHFDALWFGAGVFLVTTGSAAADMTYVPVPIMVCHLMTAFYPPSPADRPIMFREVAVQLDDPNLKGPLYFRRMPIDTGHGFTIYLMEGGPCAKAPGYLSSEKGI